MLVGSLKYVLSNAGTVESTFASPSPLPFGDDVLYFARSVSEAFLRSKSLRTYPELVALGYWLRGSNLQLIKESYLKKRDSVNSVLMPRGTAFHIAPSNVDTICVYSWMVSLLCGNKNIVRVSSRVSQQLKALLETIDDVLKKSACENIRSSVAFIQYEHSDAITSSLSSKIDTRVIWGGDETVAKIRQVPLPPTANEVAFANKISLTVIDAARWDQASDKEKRETARKFVADAYSFGQAACSSPRIIVWTGTSISICTTDSFWSMVHENLERYRAEIGDVDFVNKLVATCVVGTQFEAKLRPSTDNLLTRVSIPFTEFSKALESEHHCGGGFFFETAAESFEDILPWCNRRVQTISYYGLDTTAVRQALVGKTCAGIDRIVPIGSSLDFETVWDGFDLIDVFMRHIKIL